MTEKIKITEKSGVHEDWYKEEVTLDTLLAFLRRLMGDYEHDYGTIVHALAAGMMATMRAMNKEPGAGITGFQASCLVWEVLGRILSKQDHAMKLMDYEDMLYPQYADKFKNTITTKTWDDLREKAADLLLKNDPKDVHANVVAHWKSIDNGEVPFGYSVNTEG